MSVEHNPITIVGFFPSLEDFLDGIEQPLKEIVNMEPRYDYRTGERLEDAKVLVREAQIGYVFQGVEYIKDDTQLLLEEIAKAIGADIETIDNAWEGETYGVAITPKNSETNKYSFNEFWRMRGMHSWHSIREAQMSCAFLETKMKALKLNPGEAGVYTTMSVY